MARFVDATPNDPTIWEGDCWVEIDALRNPDGLPPS